jgi:ABC-type antimicrobial peptide transport system permease subunit
MNVASLWMLIRHDLVRVRGALVTSGFGIAAGTAALVFFLALGLGVRSVLLGEVFPIDQIELEPPKGEDPGLFGALVGLGSESPGVDDDQVKKLTSSPDVEGLFPKLRFSFPASGGGEIMGRKFGFSEMIAEGVDPALVQNDVSAGKYFADPLDKPGKNCVRTTECQAPQYCEGPAEGTGFCVDPVPVLVSRYIVEFFDKTIAPAHHLPPIGESLVKQAEGITIRLWLGESMLGKSKKGGPRHAYVRVVGISKRAMDIGLTLPLPVVRRWNTEYSGEGAAKKYSSVLVKVRSNDRVSNVIALGQTMSLSPKDTRARDVSVLLSGVMALLTLVAAIILMVSASNIAYTFRVLVSDRRREIALYRALGATAGDMIKWMLGLALTVGVAGGAVGVGVARLLALGADYLARTKLPDFPFKPHSFFAFSPALLAGALGFAALFALLGAFGPARRAGKVDPAAALAVI